LQQDDKAADEIVSVSSSSEAVQKKPAKHRGLKRPSSSLEEKRQDATSHQKLPFLKMYYNKTGKAALKDNSNGKQLFQFGSKDNSKEELYEILDRAIQRILSNRLDVEAAKGWCSAQI